MTKPQLDTVEEKASYGIGTQMGDQLKSMFKGASLDAAVQGMQDAFSGAKPALTGEQINAAFAEIQKVIEAEKSKNAGIHAKESGVDSLYSFGKLAAKAAKEFGGNGFCYDKHEDMIDALRDELSQDVTLLVKGSRSMHMENIVNALTMAEG